MTDDEIAAVRGRMELLLEEVGGCVGSLPGLVGSYRRDEAAFHERVTALERRESNCNEAARGLRSALADSLAAESFFHPTGGLVSLVTAVDAVANRAERVATELSAVELPLEGRPGEALERMADLAVEAFDALAEAVVAYLKTLESGADADPAPALKRMADSRATATTTVGTPSGPPSTPNRPPTPSRFGSSSTRRTPSPTA